MTARPLILRASFEGLVVDRPHVAHARYVETPIDGGPPWRRVVCVETRVA